MRFIKTEGATSNIDWHKNNKYVHVYTQDINPRNQVKKLII